MRIGIGIDDTICRTTEIVHDRLEKYASEKNLNSLDIMNDEFLKEEFFNIYQEDIYTNVEIKRNVAEVLKRLRSKGNEIYLISRRTNTKNTPIKRIFEITEKWLKEHDIEVDAIISSAYGEIKADVCKEYKIDLMIESNPYNYKKIIAEGTKCLLFDDREKYVLKDDYVSNWLEIEKYIERNR